MNGFIRPGMSLSAMADPIQRACKSLRETWLMLAPSEVANVQVCPPSSRYAQVGFYTTDLSQTAIAL
jgi:hypothetical protein